MSPERLNHTSPSQNEMPKGDYESILKKRELIENAYDKARTIIDRESVDPNDFKDVYPSHQIEEDLKKVEIFEHRSADETKEDIEGERLVNHMATVAEALVYQEIGLGGWLSVPGMKVFIEKTSRTDDVFNKVDIVVTFVTEDSAEPFALSIDVTMGVKTLAKKIHGIKQQLDTKHLANIKYHQNHEGEFSSLEDIPHAVLAIDPAELMRLMELWVKNDKESKERLHTHPIQNLFIEEVYLQLTEYIGYAEHKEAPAHIIEKLRTAQKMFSIIREAKNANKPILPEAYSSMLRTLQGTLRHLKDVGTPFSATRVMSPEERQRQSIVKRLRA